MKKKTLPGGHMRPSLSTSFPLQWIGFSARLMLSAFVLTTVLPVSHITIAKVSKIINATTDVSSSVLQEDTTLSMRLAFIFAFYSFAWCFYGGFFLPLFLVAADWEGQPRLLTHQLQFLAPSGESPEIPIRSVPIRVLGLPGGLCPMGHAW